MEVVTEIWNNICKDLQTNVIPRAWLVIIDPLLFDPPFLNGIAEGNVYIQWMARVGDVSYFIVRYAIAMTMLIFYMIATSFFMNLLYKTAIGRWRLVIVVATNIREEFFG